jgi:hypothetical protein
MIRLGMRSDARIFEMVSEALEALRMGEASWRFLG